MQKINLLMSVVVASCVPIFGSEAMQINTRAFSGQTTSMVLQDTLNELTELVDGSFREDTLELVSGSFRDVSTKLNDALKKILDLRNSSVTNKDIASLSTDVKDLLKKESVTKEQSDLLNLKLLDIECANHVRVWKKTDPDMRWIAAEELENLLNARAAFLSKMIKEHIRVENIATLFSKLVSFKTASEISRIEKPQDIPLENPEYFNRLAPLLNALNLNENEGKFLSISELLERCLGFEQ